LSNKSNVKCIKFSRHFSTFSETDIRQKWSAAEWEKITSCPFKAMNFRSFVTTSIRNPIRIHLKNCNKSNKPTIDKSKQNAKNLRKDWINSSLISVDWIRCWTSTSHIRITSHPSKEKKKNPFLIMIQWENQTLDWLITSPEPWAVLYSIHPIWKLFQLKSKLSNVTPPVYWFDIPTPKPYPLTMLESDIDRRDGLVE